MNIMEEFRMVLCIIGSVLLIMFNVWIIYIKKNCTKEMQAVCVQAKTMKGRHSHKIYIPVMRYEVNDTIYEQSPIGAMGNGNFWFWKIGKKYKIYVNEKNPKYFSMDKTIMIDDCFLGILGVVFVVVLFMVHFVV